MVILIVLLQNKPDCCRILELIESTGYRAARIFNVILDLQDRGFIEVTNNIYKNRSEKCIKITEKGTEFTINKLENFVVKTRT